MVAKTGKYFRHPFRWYQCVTQGDPLYPTIFNMVVDAVIRHWLTVVTPTEAVTVGLGLKIIDLEAYFDANYVLLASNQPERLHRDFDVLTGLFGRVGLCTNTANMVGMVCNPCHAPGGMEGGYYTRQTTRKDPTFRE